MELLVSYLIYILGVICAITIIALARVRIHQMNVKSDLLKVILDSKKYDLKSLDLNNYIK